MKIPFHQRLYLRIWLAVIATVAVLALVAGWLSKLEVEQDRVQRNTREVVLRNAAGEIVGQAPLRPARMRADGPEFEVQMRDGSTLTIHLPRPPRPGGERPGGGPRPRQQAQPLSFNWVLALVAVAVALGTYPIVRRITKRLEGVERGVKQWGDGDLSLRLPTDGHDEVAALARGFNSAATRVQALLLSHKALLANASHELRSPLTRIRMGLELMGSHPSPEFLAEINRNIQELDQLIDEILLASRLDSSEADIGTQEPVDLAGLAAEECARADVELQLASPPDTLVVQGVARLLRRVVRNLLENARRHAKGGIVCVLQQQGGRVELRVNDQGPGVPAALRERIFEAFYRLPGASERDGGVGLGLSLVKTIVERHGGTVHCEDNPGGGASFAVRLPQGTPGGNDPAH